jgi:energy-coupling factor transport system ATP-binding protein
LKNGEETFKGNFDDFVLLNENTLWEAGIILTEKMQLYKCAIKTGKKELAEKISSI